MARILWARHGQNVANICGTLSHRVFDGDLTRTGRQQAAALAERLAAQDDRIGRVVCSPLRRARQTAEIIAARLGLPVAAELDELRELNVGRLDGRSGPQAWAAYNAVLAAWTAGQSRARFPGGEDFAELRARLRHAMITVASGPGHQISLIVAHGASLRAALPALTGMADPGSDLAPGAVASFDISIGPAGPGICLLAWPASSDPPEPIAITQTQIQQ
jgi:broad specificity phosphatase PhoE